MATVRSRLSANALHRCDKVSVMQRDGNDRPGWLETELRTAVTTWRLFPVVEAVQALRGLNLTGAVTLIAEVGDLTRFDTPRELRSYLGLTPSEYSSGPHRRQGGITKAGNGHARRALGEGVWAYRYPAKVSRHLQLRDSGGTRIRDPAVT